MPTVVIDNQTVEVEPGATILDAARRLGIDIPTLCHLEGCTPNTSCMACVVKVRGRSSLAPSCATAAVDGMVIESETDEVRTARRTALELLLSDHAGDCYPRCQVACPANMDISRMNREIAGEEWRAAIATVKRDIPLPAVLGRICPGPCEPGCRRAPAGGPVAICKLKQFVADTDLAGDDPYLPTCAPARGKRVVVVGAGPAGLAAGYFVTVRGYACEVFDAGEQPGGALRYAVEPERLPRDVLDAEVSVIRRMGVTFHQGVSLGRDVSLDELRDDFDAVIIATGGVDDAVLAQSGLAGTPRGLRVDGATFQTSVPGVFAVGGAVRASKLAIRSVAEGKKAAACVDQYLSGEPMSPPSLGFNSRLDKLSLEQLQPWLSEASAADRTPLDDGGHDAFTPEQAVGEAARCLHCECSATADCRLRHYAQLYDADARHFAGEIGRPATLRIEHPHVIYEPGKCIACGLCVQIASREKEALGLSFIGRGFHVKVDGPFNAGLSDSIRDTAAACVAACPTGAMALRPTASMQPAGRA
jgi:glutamate synthase (NADPH) small chain